MPLYEHVFARVEDEHPAGRRTDHPDDRHRRNGGRQGRQDRELGCCSLTYRMKKNRKAHFLLMNIDALSAAVSEMERQVGSART